MPRLTSFALLTALVLASPAEAALGISAQSAPKEKEPSVVLVTTPAPPATGPTAFVVTITDPDGNPLAGADVTVTLAMPGMKNTVTLKAASDKPADAGKYAGKGQILMAGQWTATVTAKVQNKVVAEKKLSLIAK